MAKILKHDTDGTKGLLEKGEFGFDDYGAGGDQGRVYIGTGGANVALAKKSEVDNALDGLRISKVASSVLDSGTVSLTYVIDYQDTTTTTSDYLVGDFIYDTAQGKIYECISTSTTGTLLTNATYFTERTGNTLSITDGVFPYTNGKDDKGFITTSDNFTGSMDFTGVADGLYWVAKEEGATGTLSIGSGLKVYSKKPSVGLYDKTSADDNRLVFQDGKWHETTGGELVTNGTFDTDVSGWTALNSNLISWSNGQLILDRNGGTSLGMSQNNALPTIAGETYIVEVQASIKAGTPTNLSIFVETNNDGGATRDLLNITHSLGTDAYYEFVADDSDAYLTLGVGGDVNGELYIDNISVYKKQATLGTALTTPISFLPYPWMVASGTPMYEVIDIEPLADVVANNVEFNQVRAKEYKGKNACTAWVNFDGTTTPPTIRDSFNVSDVVRTATGQYDLYFTYGMDNTNYSTQATCGIANNYNAGDGYSYSNKSLSKTTIVVRDSDTSANVDADNINVTIFGGKN